MDWSSKLILAVCLFQLIFLKKSLVSGDGIDVADCKTDCACCKDQVCVPNGHFKEGNCYHGCIDGYNGARCYQKCNYNCTKCDHVDTCTSCYDGYYPGPNMDCTEQCPTGCETCTSSTYCTKCKADYYNANAYIDCRFRRCPLHCECDENVCAACEAGYYDTNLECTRKCPSNCVNCSSGDTCDVCQDGYYSGYALDNNNYLFLNNCSHECRKNCTRCSSYNDCLECESGSYGKTCQTECSVGCKSRLCLKESGNCECQTNFSSDRCVECVPGQFGTFCNKTCSSSCKHNVCVKLSGSCLDGCISPTIIGETCNACLAGMFGEFCNSTCPLNCKNKKCVRNSGVCWDRCQKNFLGLQCQNCVDGRYGENCDYLCPERCSGGICDEKSGNCQGCNGNFLGDNCENCKNGYYGPYCNDKCSNNCFISVCDRNSGLCIHGCKGNYFGDRCCLQNSNCMKCSSNTECSECKSGFYGVTCNRTCNSNCVDNLCEKETGICVIGCRGKNDDYVCVGAAEYQTSDDKPQTAIIVMGVIIAILAVVVIGLVVSKIVFWKRQYTQGRPQDASVSFENATSSANIEHRGDSFSAGSSQPSEYEKIKAAKVSEHEYEHI